MKASRLSWMGAVLALILFQTGACGLLPTGGDGSTDPVATATPAPQASPTLSPAPTESPAPTASPTPSPTASPSPTPTASPSPTPAVNFAFTLDFVSLDQTVGLDSSGGSFSKSTTLSISLTGTQDAWTWSLDGTSLAESGTTLSLDLSGLAWGPHTITASVRINGLWYSRNLNFSVKS